MTADKQKHQEKDPKLLKLFAAIIIFMTVDIIFLREYLFEISVRHQIMMRTEYYNRPLELFFHSISESCDKYGITLISCVSVSLFPMERAYMQIFIQASIIGANNILKSIFAQPRPFFLSSQIKPLKCTLEHGDPSAHTMFAMAYYFHFTLCVINSFKIQRKAMVWSFYGVFFCLIVSSRVYNGYHTYNQIFSGIFWGLAFYYTVCDVFEESIHNMVRNVRQKSLIQLLLNPVTYTFIVGYVIQILLLIYGLNYRPTPSSWLQNTIANCPNYGQRVDPNFSDFERYPVAIATIALLFGTAVEQNYFPSRDYNIHLTNGFLKHTARILINFLILFTSTIYMPFIPNDSSFTMIVLLKFAIPSFVSGFLVVSVPKYVFYKLGLIDLEHKIDIKNQESQVGKGNKNKTKIR
ncbi:pap2 superfamily phosphatase [Stylonychia lemnae]|uniref:Pap2 superfamily phosphatase n=1 Tax=Stylonychia lemnae TaxID=5949 RepID=A0A078AZA0_STYLE|nr:pap2 superfamily phosphatase [Stylonychia lemnae]|eukprot:CDW87431.1 pap2 superfamily phosphatase [Stylonychia lemnae]